MNLKEKKKPFFSFIRTVFPVSEAHDASHSSPSNDLKNNALGEKKNLSSENEGRFRQMINNAPIGISLVTIDGAILEVNSALSRIIGYSEAEFLELDFQSITHPEDIYEDLPYIEKLHNGEISFYETKKRYFHKNGHIIWVLLTVSMLRDEEGKPEYYLFQVQDITMQTEAEQMNKSKDLFLANMSHELRTPLNSIIGLVRILMEDESIPLEHRRTLQVVNKSSTSLLDIVNDILDISKIESGKVELESRPFNISGLMLTLMDQIKPLASNKGLVLNDNVEDLPLVTVMGDEFRLSRIVLNLASNAIKYTVSGSVNVNVSLTQRGDGVIDFICSVVDTGIGIPEDKIDHIFDKFTQAEESTERRFGGTGLGLNITKQLIELMGGEIQVESQVDYGSVFTVNIPFVMAGEKFDGEDEDEEGLSHLYDQSKRIPIGEARILVAEDHEFNQIFICKLLERIGCHHFHVVEDGEEAFEAFKNCGYHMVLMDCHMPKLNGYEATRTIRKHAGSNNDFDEDERVPIIAMTADAMVGTRDECLEAGMDEYISKPIDEDKFKQLMAVWFVLSDTAGGEHGSSHADSMGRVNGSAKYMPANLSILKEYVDGDPEKEKELIGIFYQKSMADIEELEKNISVKESVDWSEAAHGLKGSAGYIGAEYLRDLCAQAQDMVDPDELERKQMYKRINDEYELVCEYLIENGFLKA